MLQSFDFFINNDFVVNLLDNITHLKIFVSQWNFIVFGSQVLWEINLDEVLTSFVEECVFLVSSEEFDGAEPGYLVIGEGSWFFEPVAFFFLDYFTVFKLNGDSEVCFFFLKLDVKLSLESFLDSFKETLKTGVSIKVADGKIFEILGTIWVDWSNLFFLEINFQVKVKVYSVKKDIEAKGSFVVTDISFGVPGSGSVNQILESFSIVHVELEEERLQIS